LLFLPGQIRFDTLISSPRFNKCLLTVLRAHSSLWVASDAGAVASVVGNVVDRLLHDVARGAVVANEKVFVVVGEAEVVELGPAAADVRRVLPHELRVVANTLAALIPATEKGETVIPSFGTISEIGRILELDS
jgi:hypothetical protein